MDSLIMLVQKFDEIKPVFYDLGGKVLDVMKDLTNNKDYFDTLAKYDYEYFDSLINFGFTREEAIRLVISNKQKMMEVLNNAKNNKG